MIVYNTFMKFLVLQHVPHEHPGFITTFASKHNIMLDILELWKPYKIPTISSYDALIIMGGPMGVYDNAKVFPSKEDELRIINENINRKPILGFCLGSQLIATALGASVHPNIQASNHVKEIGYYDVFLTEKGIKSPLFTDFQPIFSVLEWHGDAFDLPKGASLLASSSFCTNQAFSYKNLYGVLFHFEFTPEMVKKQIAVDREWIHEDFTLNEEELIHQAKQYEKKMKLQSEQLLNNFLKIIKMEF